MEIEFKQIAHNRKKRSSPIKYIVIHDTGNKSRGAGRYAHFNYFNGGERNSSADFFVDSGGVLQVNDYEKYYTYHVGDGKGKYGITNSNSIGIEICVNEESDYDKAFMLTAVLTELLMEKLGILPENVVRHFDASRKKCPFSMMEDNWKKWAEFKNLITGDDKMKECKFQDITGHFAEKQIKELFDMGVVNGTDDAHFCPDNPITRGEMAVVSRNLIRYILGR